MSRAKNYCATLNNPGPQDIAHLDRLRVNDGVAWMITQLEEGANGTVHIQFAVTFTEKQTPANAMKILQGTMEYGHWSNPIVVVDDANPGIAIWVDDDSEGDYEPM